MFKKCIELKGRDTDSIKDICWMHFTMWGNEACHFSSPFDFQINEHPSWSNHLNQFQIIFLNGLIIFVMNFSV